MCAGRSPEKYATIVKEAYTYAHAMLLARDKSAVEGDGTQEATSSWAVEQVSAAPRPNCDRLRLVGP